jgi:hypothetical protein
MWGTLNTVWAKVITTRLAGALKSVLASLELLDDADISHDEPMMGVPGFFCRPRPPVAKEDETGLDPEGACEAVALRVGDQTIPIAYRDLRLSSVVNPKEGELGLAHYGGGFVSLKLNTDEDGTNIVLYAPRKNSSGTVTNASCVSIDSTDGNQHICLLHESGASITLTKEGKILLMNKTGNAYVEINDDGIFLNGNCYLNGSVILGDKTAALVKAVANADLVLSELSTIQGLYNAHTHNDSLLAPTTAPLAPLPAPSPVAATMVQAL